MAARKSCCVLSCRSRSRYNDSMSFFSLPKDLERRSKWLDTINREDLMDKSPQSYYVCNLHFPGHSVIATPRRPRLISNSVPSLNLPNSIYIHKSVQTVETMAVLKLTSETMIDASTQAPEAIVSGRKRTKTDIEISRYKEKKKIKTFNKLCKKYLTKKVLHRLKGHIKFTKQSQSNWHYLENLQITNYPVYKMLEQALRLPVSSLAENSVATIVKLNKHLRLTLEEKLVTRSKRAKNCIIYADVMTLEKNIFDDIESDCTDRKSRGLDKAKYALVVTARGINDGWRHPVGYKLLFKLKYDMIYNWIDKIIIKLLKSGLNIRAYTENELLTENTKRLVSIEMPYFVLDNRQIYYIFNPLHLSKLVRDHMMSYHFRFQGCTAKWVHVLEYFKKDKKRNFRLTPTFTDIKLNKAHDTAGGLVDKIFNSSVAAGIEVCAHYKVVNTSAKDTAKLIRELHKLFNIINSFFMSPARDKMQYTDEESQRSYLNELLNFFRSLKLIDPLTGKDVTSDIKLNETFEISIMSILLMFDELKLEQCLFDVD